MKTKHYFLDALTASTVLLLLTNASHAQELNQGGPSTRQIEKASGQIQKENLTPAQKLNRQAIQAMRAKEWKNVFTLLTQAMMEDPGEIQTYLNFGVAHYMRKEYPSCEGATRKALEIEPENDRAHFLFSKVIVLKGQQELAISSAKKAFELSDPKEWTYMNWLAELHEGEDNFKAAVDCYSEALGLLQEKLDTVNTGISNAEAREIITDTWEEIDIYYDPGSGYMEELQVQKYQTEPGKAPDAWIQMKKNLESQILDITARKDEVLELAGS